MAPTLNKHTFLIPLPGNKGVMITCKLQASVLEQNNNLQEGWLPCTTPKKATTKSLPLTSSQTYWAAVGMEGISKVALPLRETSSLV